MRGLINTLAGFFFLSISLVTASVAIAQSPPGEFENVVAFKLQTAGFGAAAKECGLQKDEAVAAFSQVLENAGVRVVPSSSAYWISLRVTSLITQGTTCLTYIETAAYQTTRYVNNATRQERVGKVVHWVDGGFFVSSPESHAPVVLRGFKDLGAKLAAKWQSDQQ